MNDDLDRLLEGLGKVEAPEGLERRILVRLESEGSRKPERVWFWAVAAAALLAAIAAIRHVPTIPATTGHRAEPAIKAANPATFARAITPETVRRQSPKHAESLLPRGMPAQPRAAIENGFPAPEAPLTEQERLLLRLAQRPTPGTLAMFDDKVQRQRAEAEKAELDRLSPVQPLVGPKADATEFKEIHNDEVYAKR